MFIETDEKKISRSPLKSEAAGKISCPERVAIAYIRAKTAPYAIEEMKMAVAFECFLYKDTAMQTDGITYATDNKAAGSE